MKDLEDKKNKELAEKIREFETTTEILNKKIHDMEKAGMEQKISELETELDEAREEKQQCESEMQDLKDQIFEMSEKIGELVRLQQLPWWKKMFGKTE